MLCWTDHSDLMNLATERPTVLHVPMANNAVTYLGPKYQTSPQELDLAFPISLPGPVLVLCGVKCSYTFEDLGRDVSTCRRSTGSLRSSSTVFYKLHYCFMLVLLH